MTLDDLERSVLHRLAPLTAEDAQLLRNELDRAESPEGLYRAPPPVDPSEGRRSTAELHALLDALTGASAPTRHARTRAGYALVPEGHRKFEAGVFPAFVAELARQDKLREKFPDLWAVDALLWDKLDTSTSEELARTWLESPGRRLVQDLGAIDRMPSDEPIGATDCSLARIYAAAGLDLVEVESVPEPFRAHHEQHCSVPVERFFERWEPKPISTQRNQQILRALQLLEGASAFGMRGAALAWLLDQAADKPFYEVDGMRRDLREDLSLRLGIALDAWLGDAPTTAVLRQLESGVLQHAARFVKSDMSEHATRRAWAVARWLQGCLRRSPFFGGDDEVLAANLLARLPRQMPSKGDVDVLHPSRFSADTGGLDLGEVAFVAAVIHHYRRDRQRTLLPTPMPIVFALHRLAKREVFPAEVDADHVLAGEHAEKLNSLQWPTEYSLIAPMAARRLMTELRIGWLAQAGEAAQLDTLERFFDQPARHEWFAFAVHREGHQLAQPARDRAARGFREFLRSNQTKPHILGTFGAGILDELTDDEARFVVDIALTCDAPWRPFVLDAHVGSAERLERGALWTHVVERLIALLESADLDERVRLNAALFAMRRLSASKMPSRQGMLQRFAIALASSPFIKHPSLRTEMGRLGLTLPSASGSRR